MYKIVVEEVIVREDERKFTQDVYSQFVPDIDIMEIIMAVNKVYRMEMSPAHFTDKEENV